MDRTSLCLGCRTPLPQGQPCELQCAAGTVSLSDREQRQRLIQEVWDGSLLRYTPKPQAKKVDYSSLRIPIVASVLGLLLLATPISAIGPILIIGPWGLVPFLAGRSSRKLLAAAPIQEASSSMHHGIVSAVPEASQLAPAGKQPCLGYSLILHYSTAKSDTLVDSYSYGCTVNLHDGRVVHIPAGRIRLTGGVRKSFPKSTPMLAWWTRVDPYHFSTERSPCPHDRIDEVRLQSGQHIHIQNDLILTAKQHRSAGYRDMSGNILEPVGTPRIHIKTTHPKG